MVLQGEVTGQTPGTGEMALGTEQWGCSLTSCLLPGSGLRGQASLAAASWVRKEEKSHILWWLYPLGSLPETLAAEQIVEPSGVEGQLGPADPAQTEGRMRKRGMENAVGSRWGPGWGAKG